MSSDGPSERAMSAASDILAARTDLARIIDSAIDAAVRERTEACAREIDGMAAACDAEVEAASEKLARDFWCAQRGQLKRGATAIRALNKGGTDG